MKYMKIDAMPRYLLIIFLLVLVVLITISA
jgi:hypothetical protein